MAPIMAVVGGTDVHHQAGQSRSHADGLGHVQRLFGIVAVAAGLEYASMVLVPSVESRVMGT
jgi:hypothetical protein